MRGCVWCQVGDALAKAAQGSAAAGSAPCVSHSGLLVLQAIVVETEGLRTRITEWETAAAALQQEGPDTPGPTFLPYLYGLRHSCSPCLGD